MAPPARSDRLKRLSLAALLVVVVAAVFGRAVDGSFVLVDDDINVYRNPMVNPPSAEGLREIWAEPYKGLYFHADYGANWIRAFRTPSE